MLLCAAFVAAHAQPAIQWQRCLGGSGNDNVSSVSQTADSGYIISGGTFSTNGDVTGSHGASDYWVVKLSKTGAIEWQKCYGGTGEDFAYDAKQTTDGGYIIAGTTMSTDGDVTGNHGFGDYWIIKTDAVGTILWQKCFGGTYNDIAYSIEQTNEGGYIVAGLAGSFDGDITTSLGHNDYWIVKLSATGTLQWQRSIGGSNDDQATSIKQTHDSGYIVTGMARSNDLYVSGHHGLYDYWVAKLSPTGTVLWSKAMGGSGTDCSGFGCDKAYSVAECSDSGFITVGMSNSIDGDVTDLHTLAGSWVGPIDAWIVKFSPAGTVEWKKCLGSTGAEIARSVSRTSDGGYLIGANTNGMVNYDVTSNHSATQDQWLIKINDTGAIEWQKCFGGTLSDDLYACRQTMDGGYVMAGTAWSNDGDVSGNHGGTDFWIVKLSDTVYAACDTVNSLTAVTATTSADLSWSPVPGAIHYEYVVNTAHYDPFGSGTVVTGTTTSVSGLGTGYVYYVHIRVYCGHGNYSPWAVFSFFSPCDTVSSLAATGITATGATVSWGVTWAAYHYEYVVDLLPTVPTGSGTSVTTTSVTLTGLMPGTTYYAHLRDSCPMGHFSTWTTLAFTTLCDTVKGVTISGIAATAATINWLPAPGALLYQYAATTSATPPSVPGTNTTLTTATVTGLTPGTAYYAHVRDSCGMSQFSPWTTAPFTTLPSVADVYNVQGNCSLTVYPNPARDLITLTLPGPARIDGAVQLTDIAGILMDQWTMQGSTLHIHTGHLPQGAYILKYMDATHRQVIKVNKE